MLQTASIFSTHIKARDDLGVLLKKFSNVPRLASWMMHSLTFICFVLLQADPFPQHQTFLPSYSSYCKTSIITHTPPWSSLFFYVDFIILHHPESLTFDILLVCPCDVPSVQLPAIWNVLISIHLIFSTFFICRVWYKRYDVDHMSHGSHIFTKHIFDADVSIIYFNNLNIEENKCHKTHQNEKCSHTMVQL